MIKKEERIRQTERVFKRHGLMIKEIRTTYCFLSYFVSRLLVCNLLRLQTALEANPVAAVGGVVAWDACLY